MSKRKTSSGSSVRGAQRVKKGSVTLPKINVRYVEFTPEEMAYDCPADTSDPKRFPTITRGDKDWKKFIKFRNGFVRLEPSVRKAFPNDKSVNQALRSVLKNSKNSKRKSA